MLLPLSSWPVCGLPKNSKAANAVSPSEVRRADSGSGALGEGQLAPSPSAREFGERCKLPRGEVQPLNDFPVVRGLQAAYAATLLNVIITLSATLLLLRKQLQKSLNLTARRVAPTPPGA